MFQLLRDLLAVFRSGDDELIIAARHDIQALRNIADKRRTRHSDSQPRGGGKDDCPAPDNELLLAELRELLLAELRDTMDHKKPVKD